MVQNALFRQCLASVPEDQKAEFELSWLTVFVWAIHGQNL